MTWNLETNIVWDVARTERSSLPQQTGNLHTFGLVSTKKPLVYVSLYDIRLLHDGIEKLLHGPPRVYDVLHYQNIFASQVV